MYKNTAAGHCWTHNLNVHIEGLIWLFTHENTEKQALNFFPELLVVLVIRIKVSNWDEYYPLWCNVFSYSGGFKIQVKWTQ
jgi:hypothetical protein